MEKYLHVFVNAFWNEGSGMTGGDKRVIEILKKWKQNENFEFSIIIYAPQKFLDLLVNENIDNVEFRYTAPKGSEKRGLIFSYICRTFRVLRLIPYYDTNVHYFYSTSDYFPDVIPCVLGKVMNKKAGWIALVHNIYEHYKTRPGNKIMNFILYYLQQFSLFLMKGKSDRVLVVSPLVKHYLIDKKKFNKRKIQKVDNGVDTALIDSIVSWEDKEKHYDAVILARLAPVKGIYDLPVIWKKVMNKDSSARLAIIGGGTDEIKNELLKQCNLHGVRDNIDLLGYFEPELAFQYLKSAKVFVFTSRTEGWGISIAEAMACGLPVVAYSLPIYKYVFPKGIKLIENRDAEKMSEQIVDLLNNQEEREKLGKDGRQYVQENYEWSKVAENEIDIIKGVHREHGFKR